MPRDANGNYYPRQDESFEARLDRERARRVGEARLREAEKLERKRRHRCVRCNKRLGLVDRLLRWTCHEHCLPVWDTTEERKRLHLCGGCGKQLGSVELFFKRTWHRRCLP